MGLGRDSKTFNANIHTMAFSTDS